MLDATRVEDMVKQYFHKVESVSWLVIVYSRQNFHLTILSENEIYICTFLVRGPQRVSRWHGVMISIIGSISQKKFWATAQPLMITSPSIWHSWCMLGWFQTGLKVSHVDLFLAYFLRSDIKVTLRFVSTMLSTQLMHLWTGSDKCEGLTQTKSVTLIYFSRSASHTLTLIACYHIYNIIVQSNSAFWD